MSTTTMTAFAGEHLHLARALTPNVRESFWLSANRQDFTACCWHQWEARMRFSREQAMVAGVTIGELPPRRKAGLP